MTLHSFWKILLLTRPMFNTNLHIASILQLPVGLRQTKNVAWAKALTTLVKDLMAVFTVYRSEKLFFLAHNSQVVYLEHILNYYFNPAVNAADPDYLGNGIYISDGIENDELYIFNTEELADDTFLHNSSETPFTEVYLHDSDTYIPVVGFVINIPDTFTIDENRLRALVNRLRLAGKLYTIKYYTI